MKTLINCRIELEKHRKILNRLVSEWGINNPRALDESRMLDKLIIKEKKLADELYRKTQKIT